MEAVPDISPQATNQLDETSQERQQWVISIREKLKEAHEYSSRRPWEKWCIYRLPRRLREVQEDQKAYVPQTISIGRYHLGSEHVLDMDRHKWVTLHQILERTGQDLTVYLDSIKEVEEQARACYQHEVHLSSYKFVEMMVLDGCFILELFRCYPKTGPTVNPIFSNKRIVDDILLDMVMLENQIPLFIIDRLLKLMCVSSHSGDDQNEQAIVLAMNLFNSEWFTGKSLSIREFNELKMSLRQEKCLHVLDVFRRSILHAGPNQGIKHRYGFQSRICDKLIPGCLKGWLHANKVSNRISRKGQVIHRVTELRQGGVKFKKWNTNCFWDIKFKNGVLEIPTIWIQDSTMTILLNVAAFEHCHLKVNEAVIASYVVFMECLLKVPEDVSYLQRRGIIQHVLGQDTEVVDIFKRISKELLVDVRGGYYEVLSKQVNAYYSRRRNKWRAILLSKYLNNPWAIISIVVALILLVLTSIQSFYAVYSYYRPNSH